MRNSWRKVVPDGSRADAPFWLAGGSATCGGTEDEVVQTVGPVVSHEEATTNHKGFAHRR